MVDIPLPPFRRAFDAARDPLTARNALGITSTGGSGGGFITAVTAPLQVTGTTLSIDLSAYLTTATAAATYQPLDADLTALAALTGTNTIYYRSGANTWSPVVVSTGLAFSGGNLTATGGGGTSTPVPPQGRLTLQTATPVMTTTQAAKTTIYYTPYVGNQILLYNGTSMVPTTFTELSVATTDTTKSPAAIGASKVNDWFIWSDAGTIRVGHGPDWTSDTARSAGTALTMVNGILLNNASITNGPAAQRGTYVGTTRSNASSQLDWIYGTQVTNGGAAFFYVWNAYNRANVVTDVMDSGTWAGGTALTWRRAHNSDGNRVSWVCGLAEDSFEAAYTVAASNSGGARFSGGIGIDSITVATGPVASLSISGNSSTTAAVAISPLLGAHYAQALEFPSTGTTFIGAAGADIQNGLHFSGRF